MSSESYQVEIAQWREERDASLRCENGWLALAGLFWLHEGQNSIGAALSSDIVLPSSAAPEHLGSVELVENQVRLRVTGSEDVREDGRPVQEAILRPDTTGSPNRITLNGLAMVALQRGDRFGIRLWDNNRPERQTFPGRRWYPVRETYRVAGEYHASTSAPAVSVPNIFGQPEEIAPDGFVTFEVGGEACRLLSFKKEDSGLFLMFKDLTSGSETYPAGRYVVARLRPDGGLILDFNQAYSPPCAFTRYATCSFAPPQNHLRVKIEAGELYDTHPAAAPAQAVSQRASRARDG